MVSHYGFRFQPDDSPLEQLEIVAVATLERSWQPTSCAGDPTVQYSTVILETSTRSSVILKHEVKTTRSFKLCFVRI